MNHPSRIAISASLESRVRRPCRSAFRCAASRASSGVPCTASSMRWPAVKLPVDRYASRCCVEAAMTANPQIAATAITSRSRCPSANCQAAHAATSAAETKMPSVCPAAASPAASAGPATHNQRFPLSRIRG